VRDHIVMPLAQENPAGSVLTARALREYPGYAFVRLYATSRAAAAGEDGGVSAVFIELADRVHKGFTYTAVYTAPSSVADDPAVYENPDSFFRTPVSPRQPTDSFIQMWMETRPTYVCDYVTELGVSTDTTRSYQIDYSFPARRGIDTKTKTAYYSYSPSTGAWVETAMPQEAVAVPDDSAVDTAAAVAQALPSFEVVGAAQEPWGPWVAIVRHTAFPKVRVAVYAEYLGEPDTSDGIRALFGTPSKRADGFAKMWTARHPGTIIESIEFDPEFVGDSTLVDVGYSPGSAEDVGVGDRVKYERFRYRASSGAWSPVR
jgi:hypothetical protein